MLTAPVSDNSYVAIWHFHLRSPRELTSLERSMRSLKTQSSPPFQLPDRVPTQGKGSVAVAYGPFSHYAPCTQPQSNHEGGIFIPRTNTNVNSTQGEFTLYGYAKGSSLGFESSAQDTNTSHVY